MRYSVEVTSNNKYIVTKNNKPINLVGVGIEEFDTKEDAEYYIRQIKFSQWLIDQGVPE